ncbi:MAG: redoxin family protein [Chromatiaceae bacterium]|nr:redoxin family protein [Gammaproteobacteria bacterium]MCP5304989.1 redoxin family protein [Chromatiaceae bacterium]MCP5314948.1 redoxin family protein [Chromatiaceae bacterium]
MHANHRPLLIPALCLLLTSVVAAADPQPLPEFTTTRAEHWFNSPPLSVHDLRGQVLLVDVWTYDCWNCYRSFPWLRDLEQRYADRGLRVIGIHSPEFDHERDADRVAAKIAEFELHHPVMMDNDFAYWRALGNRYWPAYYLVDRRGRIRASFVGETHAGDARARQVEEQIRALLAES